MLSAFQFIPRVFGEVEVKALCRSREFVNTNFCNLSASLCTSLEHRSIVMFGPHIVCKEKTVKLQHKRSCTIVCLCGKSLKKHHKWARCSGVHILSISLYLYEYRLLSTYDHSRFRQSCRKSIRLKVGLQHG